MKKLLILLIALALLFSGCSYIIDVKNKTIKVLQDGKGKVSEVFNSAKNFKDSMLGYWACMDGCYFMQKIHEEKYGLNITKEDHDICAAICWEKYGGKR